MASLEEKQSFVEDSSLQSILASIDLETAPALAQDMELLKERATRNLRKRKPHISFILGVHEMALPLGAIQEIGYLPTVTPLPNVPQWIKGIIQIRGEILSVLDFPLLFGLREERNFTQKTPYILFMHQDLKYCLPVGRITGVVSFDEQHDQLHAYAAQEGDELSAIAPFFKGMVQVDKRRVFILDVERMGSARRIRRWQ